MTQGVYIERALFVVGDQNTGKSTQLRSMFLDWRLNIQGVVPTTKKVRITHALSNERWLYLRLMSPHETGEMLDEFPDDSGKRAGIRYIRGGRIVPRNALYMAAMTAIRHNSDMNRLYQSLVEKGKPHKVALVAVMRKMIILANVLLRDDRKWSALAPAQNGG